MCVAALAWSAHPEWRLLVIGNRDEYHDRPAAPLERWPDGSGVLAGRDLRSGGTWLGVSQAGRFVLVTNRRGYGEPEAGRVSRGKLVTDLLTGTGNYADPDPAQLADFNPFNVLAGRGTELAYLANRPEPVRARLSAGIYGLSNGALDEPWPKTLTLKAALLDWLGKQDGDIAPLFAALASESLPVAGLHPQSPSDISAEALETAPFIRNPVYGTRCSTVIAVDKAGQGAIWERRFDAQGQNTGETRLAFRWPE